MSSFLKSLFYSANKHKKLSEEWSNSREPVVDGVTFYVRYLGSSLVQDPKCAQSTTAGVKRVIHAAKAGARRPERVAFRVAMEGVRIDSTTTGETIMDTSIYKISYCSADSQYEQILAFVASNADDRCECHAFLCSKRKVAEAIAVSIAQAFTMAYECWKLAIEAKKNGETSLTSEEASDREDALLSRSGCSKSGDGNNSSRASSPEHSPGYSSPPSEVSSTSGYQSSTACGMLLELDYRDTGNGELEVPEPLQVPAPEESLSREHWTSFEDLSDLAETFGRLNLDQARGCCQKITCAAAATSGSNPQESTRGKAQRVLDQKTSKTASGSYHYEATASVPSVGISVAAATPCLQTLSSNSSPLLTDCILTADLGHVSPVTNAANRQSNLPRYGVSNGNSSDVAIFNDLKSSSARIGSCDSRMLKSGVCLQKDSTLDSIPERNNFMNPKPGTVVTYNGAGQLKCTKANNVQLARSEWESFDTSPPQSVPFNTFALPSAFSLKLPATSTNFLKNAIVSRGCSSELVSAYVSPETPWAETSVISESLNSHPGASSPITAFLDSCLTPRTEKENCERRFEFSGRLSGEEHNFNDFNSADLGHDTCAKITQNLKPDVDDLEPQFKDSDSGQSYHGKVVSVQTEQKGLHELVK